MPPGAGVFLHGGHCCFGTDDATCHQEELEQYYPEARKIREQREAAAEQNSMPAAD